MSDWSSGYVSDIGYTFGYYAELNPMRLKLAFLNAGLAAPEVGAACELGFGQGLSANVHAAASVTTWHGTDFNPSQAAHAQELASAAGSGAMLADEAFADFCMRTDLPDFDFIGLHGIWSWISDENRQVIVDFVRRKLKVGGVLYISYNTLPGWAAFAPMRHLLTQHAEVIGANGGGTISQVNGALQFADKLLATNPLFTRANPQVTERLKKLGEQNRQYLAHEYFNRDWHPMHFATMAEWLGPSKVSYACSAHPLDHIDAVNLTAEQQALLQEIPDAMFRESVRDFMVNQQFRRDYWVKGPRKLAPLEQTEMLRKQRLVLTSLRADVSLKVTGSLGEATMTEAIYAPVLDFLADNHPRTLGEIEKVASDKKVNFSQLVQAVMVLSAGGHLAIAHSESDTAGAKLHTDRLNLHLMQKARSTGDISYLASPLTGGAISVGRFQQLFLLALHNGKAAPADWAKEVWAVLSAQGQRIVKDGVALEGEANTAELDRQAQQFAKRQLPLLRALGIA
ncbi:MAG: class I SAM-dependent methyltransferase [Pseudomonadota bacterium]